MAATARLKAASCAVGRITTARRPATGRRLRVRRQSVPAGTKVLAGTTVALVLRRGR